MKKPINIRVDEELLESYDQWCAARGVTRTQALEQHMRASTNPAESKAPLALVGGIRRSKSLLRTNVEPMFKAPKK